MTFEHPPKSIVTALRRNLLRWYRREARDLPWRRTQDPYAVWVSEIMLQQTRIDQGAPYYERFMAAFPTVEALAAASDDAVLKLWEGLGYYSRARNLHKAARLVAEGGRFPETAEAWTELPGVGRYTAGAIASIVFGERAPVVDGNVIRVLARLFDIEACTDDTATRKVLWALAETLVPPKNPGDFNQALMELGAMVCTPKSPVCDGCPVRNQCQAREEGVQEQRPVRKAKKRVPHHEIVVAAIRKDGQYLIGKRPPGGLLGGLWEFPGGKVEPGESHQQALRREVKEELGVTVRIGGLVTSVNHAYSHFRVTLNVYRCTLTRGTPVPHSHTELRWVALEEFGDLAFPKANHKFLGLL
ncbi:MAG: A/G-specific adenine glycosylase [bacterium]|nr:A/G-specific adenine glycosylase [bacterium]